MLIDLTRQGAGPRISHHIAPKSLVVAVLDGKVTQRTMMGTQVPLTTPDACAAAPKGRVISAFRLRPSTSVMPFKDRDATGWEFSAWSQNAESLDYTYVVLVQEEGAGWGCWFRQGQGTQRLVLALPNYDPHDNDPFMLEPLREIPPDGPSRYERLGGDL